MSDGRDIVPTKTLVKQGTAGVGGVVGGAAILLLRALGPVGGIIGAILAVAGIGVAAASKEDRIAGGVVAVAGTLTALSGFGIFGSGFLLIGGVGLLLTGAYSLFKFVRGLRARR